MPSDNRVGRYERSTTAGESYDAFIPHPLPPANPPLQLTHVHERLLEKANWALGRLDGLSTQLPNAGLLLYFYVRKEALLSSQIEGAQSSFSDLIMFENEEVPGVPLEDVVEVSRYVAALTHGIARVRGGFPLSLRLIREVHETLLSDGRGSAKAPGEFRRSQNWIGGRRPGTARFVPPPPEYLPDCLGNLETFLHDESVPLLIKAALSHVQFETIHPFLDGNGRVGRLLITLMLCAEGVLTEPMLYLSLYFKQERELYYDYLQRVRTEADWEGWIAFFLEGIYETSIRTFNDARRILDLFESDRRKAEAQKRAAGSVLEMLRLLQSKPIISISKAAAATGMSFPTATTALSHLSKLGIVRELTGRERNRLFIYDEYLKILNEGTEPLKGD